MLVKFYIHGDILEETKIEKKDQNVNEFANVCANDIFSVSSHSHLISGNVMIC